MSQSNREKKNTVKNQNIRSKKNFNNNNVLECISITSKLRIAIITCLLLAVFYPPFLRGLFFENEQLFTEIFVFIVYIAFWIYKLLRKDKKFLTTTLDYIALGFVVIYFISLFPAIDKYLAISEWLKYCMYFALFHMVSEIVITYKARVVVLWTVIVTSCFVSAIGLDALAGGKVVDALNNFFSTIGFTKVLGLKKMFFDLTIGNRISSTFQYPNTLASYLIAAFFVLVGLVIVGKSLWLKAAGGCAGFIVFTTFMLTSSRGAYVMFPLVGIIFLITLPKGNKLKALFYTIIYVSVGGLLSFRLLSIVSDNEHAYNKFWLVVAAGAAICALLTVIMTFIVRLLEKLNWKVYAISISTLVLLTVIALVYVFNVTQPVVLSNIDAQKDSWKSVFRSMVLKPGHEYKLVFNVEASMVEEKPYAYYVNVVSRSKEDILFDKTTQLASVTGQATQGVKTEEISFKVPEDSEIVRFNFINYYQGTEAIYYDAVITDASSGKMVKELVLSYKYIPDALITRLDDIQATKSGVQRLVYYKDGLNIIKDRPLFGAGGGAWSLLYFMYQSYLYFSTQAHNYFLQLGVETGIIGLLALLALLLVFIFMYIFEYICSGECCESDDHRAKVLQSAIFTAICALFMHSFMDFDFSLASVFMLVWMLLGLYNSHYKAINFNELKHSGHKNRLTIWAQYIVNKLVKVKKIAFSPIIGIILTITVGTFSVLFFTAKGYAKDSQLASFYDAEEALEKMKIASILNPFSLDYKVDYANLLIKKKDLTQKEIIKALDIIKYAEKSNKYNAAIKAKIGSFYLATSYIDKGLQLFDEICILKPLDPTAWETRINAYSSVIEYYFNNNDLDKAYSYISRVKNIINQAKEINNENLNPFIFENIEVIEKIEEFRFIEMNMNYKNDVNITGEVLKDIMKGFVFLNYPELDINNDKIPDQWTLQDPTSTKVLVESGNMVVDNTKKGYGKIISRNLNLEAGKNYTIEVKVMNGETLEKIDYNLSGVSNASGALIKSGNTFVVDIAVPSNFTPGNNKLSLGIPGKTIITDIRIYEKQT